MKKHNFFVILSFLIIFSIILIAGTALSSCSINLKEVLKSLGIVTLENEKDEGLEEEKKGEGKITEESGVEATSKETQDDFNKWNTYVNDIYGYEFKYPADAEIVEAQKSGFGVVCITINCKLGYITIAVPENDVECGRSGVGNEYEIKDIKEEFTIEGKKYIAKGWELVGKGETLKFHQEFLRLTLDNGIRIEYGSRDDDKAIFEDYLKDKKVLKKIIESIKNTTTVTAETTLTTKNVTKIIDNKELQEFIGYWSNIDLKTRNITKVKIRVENNQVFIHIWGACVPKDCDWGEEIPDSYDSEDSIIFITWKQSFVIKNQQINILSDGKLQVKTHVYFTADNSCRSDYDALDIFNKVTNNE